MPEHDHEPPAPPETVAKALAAVVPWVGAGLQVVVEDALARRHARARQTAHEIIEATGGDALVDRLSASPELDALFAEALEAAMRTGHEAKRRTLARVVINAVTDDARVDESQLLAMALGQLEGPHIRALARLRAAELGAPGEPLDASFDKGNAVSDQQPKAVISVLIATGTVVPTTFVGGGIGACAVTDLGRLLIADLEAADSA